MNTGTDAIASAVEASLGIKQSGVAISTDVEHQALAAALARSAPANDAKVLRAKIGHNGQLDLGFLDSLLDEKITLVALHHVQPETGVVQDLLAVRKLLDAKASKALLLADTTQSAFKLKVPWNEARLDFAMVSGAKIGAPCGAALLYRDDSRGMLGTRLQWLRSTAHRTGRCPAAACVAIAQAAKELGPSLDERLEKARTVKAAYKKALVEALGPKIRFTAPDEFASPYILHLLAPGVQGATIVRMMAERNYSISAGSACEAEAKSPSKALLVMGVGRADAYSALRVSFWKDSSPEDAVPFAAALAECVRDY
jgi:cysteine desulfurase